MIKTVEFPTDIILFPEYPDEQRVGPKLWEFRRPYGYVWEHLGRMHLLQVRTGFRYDGASVPRIVRGLIEPELLHKAAGPHDYGYHHRGLFPVGTHLVRTPDGWVDALTLPSGIRVAWTRRDLDRLFARMCGEDYDDGPADWERRLAFRGIRAGGWYQWMQAGRERAA